jgi:NodT family efflux transporter outer membrane factor (OMF) lipoprotein
MKRTFFPVAVVLLTAGCTLGPDYRRPDVGAPAFKESGDWKHMRPAANVSRGKWWKVFGDSTLNSLQDQLEISSNTIQLAAAQYRQAEASAIVANAALFPTLNGNIGTTRAQSAGHSNVQGSLENSYNIGTTLNWEIDLWGRVRRGTEAVNANTAAAADTLESVRLSSHSLLAQTYVSLRVADARGILYQRSIKDFEKSQEITRNLFAQGMNTRADVAAAESQLKTTQAQAIDLQLQRAQLEHSIATLIGKAPVAVSIPVADLKTKPPAAPRLIASEQLQRRPDISAAERQLASACARIGFAEAGFFPAISLSGLLGTQSSAYRKLFSASSEVWSLGAAATGPIFDGGATRGNVANAKAVYDAALANYRQSVLTAFQEIEDNLAANTLLAQEAAAQDQAVKSARESTTVALNQYKAGSISYLNVVTAQANQLTAEQTAVALRGRQLNASVILYKTAGGLP